MQRATWPG